MNAFKQLDSITENTVDFSRFSFTLRILLALITGFKEKLFYDVILL